MCHSPLRKLYSTVSKSATSSADPRLLGALRKNVSLPECVCVCVCLFWGWGGVLGWKNGWNAFVRVSLRLELFRGSVHSFLWRSVWRSRYMILLTFYVERVRKHRIKIIDHFHNRWPTSKTKLKHLWEQGVSEEETFKQNNKNKILKKITYCTFKWTKSKEMSTIELH